MKAVVLATALPRDTGTAAAPAGLRMLLDRPFIQHVVERLVDRGANALEVVVSDAPEEVRRILGDGRRWGVSIRYHLARDAGRPMPAVKRAVSRHPEPVLLARADRLWELGDAPPASSPVVYCVSGASSAAGESASQWAGLAALPPATLLRAPEDLDDAGFADWLVSVGSEQGMNRAASLSASCDSIAAWLAAQRAALEGRITGLQSGGREAEPGIWLSRNVSLAPSARLEPPVYVGEDCRIEADAVLGTGTVVGAGSVIARGARLVGALVLPGSYVGESVSLEDVAADRGLLFHGGLGVATPVHDRHLLAAVASPGPGARLRRAALRLVAGLLFLPLLPLAAVAMLVLRATGRRLTSREVVRLPAPSDRGRWRTTRLWDVSPTGPDWLGGVVRAVAGLFAIARGHLDLVGVTPRAPEDIEVLPAPLRAVYLQGRGGLVTEASVTLGPAASAEDQLAADLAYVVSRSVRRDLGILMQATVS